VTRRSASPHAPPPARGWKGANVLAVGHSTRPIEDFVALLEGHGVAVVADIRRYPHSWRNPQFEQEALRRALASSGIGYAHVPELGGRRRPSRDSVNTAWRNEGFRGYADHLASAEFARGLVELRRLARQGPVAVMCAEGNPRRCHRSLLCDALLARGVVARHITSRTSSSPHAPPRFARMDGACVTYPGAHVGSPGKARPQRRPMRRRSSTTSSTSVKAPLG
jgi:uncharacterized protein (DUF488 family)